MENDDDDISLAFQCGLAKSTTHNGTNFLMLQTYKTSNTHTLSDCEGRI